MRLEDELKTNRFMDDVHKAQLNILFSAAWLRARLSTSLKPLGLTLEQFNVLRIVRGRHPEGILIKDITSRMLERNSNTTRILDRLEAKNLVIRTILPHDRRERLITLTAEGIERLLAVDRCWQENNPHSASWTPEEARLVHRLLDKMRE